MDGTIFASGGGEIIAAANTAAQAHGFPSSFARAAADTTSGVDPNALAIDTFLRTGCVLTSDEARRVVRWKIVRGILIEQRKIGAGGAVTPLQRTLCTAEGPLGNLGRVASFIGVPLLAPEELTMDIDRPATSEGYAHGTAATMLGSTVGWMTDPIPAGQTENVILCVAQHSGVRVTSFELATREHDGVKSEVMIEIVDAGGNPLETLVRWQSFGTCSGRGTHYPRAYTPQTFPLAVPTFATRFRITLRHTNPKGEHGRSPPTSGGGRRAFSPPTSAGLAICRVHGCSPPTSGGGRGAFSPPGGRLTVRMDDCMVVRFERCTDAAGAGASTSSSPTATEVAHDPSQFRIVVSCKSDPSGELFAGRDLDERVDGTYTFSPVGADGDDEGRHSDRPEWTMGDTTWTFCWMEDDGGQWMFGPNILCDSDAAVPPTTGWYMELELPPTLQTLLTTNVDQLPRASVLAALLPAAPPPQVCCLRLECF